MKEIFVLGFELFSLDELITPPYGPGKRISDYHDFLHKFNVEEKLKELRVESTFFYPYDGINEPFDIRNMISSFAVMNEPNSYKVVKVKRTVVDNFLLKSRLVVSYNLNLVTSAEFDKQTRIMLKEVPKRLSEVFFSLRLGLNAYILKDNKVVVKDALSYKYNVIGVLDNAKDFKALIDLLYDYYVVRKRPNEQVALHDTDLYQSFKFMIPVGA